MKMGAAGGGGGGRKVLDKNYFLTELRQKRSEIANVTQSMQVSPLTGGMHAAWMVDLSGSTSMHGRQLYQTKYPLPHLSGRARAV